MAPGGNDDVTRRQVTVPTELDDRVCSLYPAASSAAQALVMAAQDGVHVRESYGSCFDDRVRSIVRDELESREE